MKIIELKNKILTPMTNEESALLKRFIGNTPVPKSHLGLREQELAYKLTIKDALVRTNTDGKIYYTKIID